MSYDQFAPFYTIGSPRRRLIHLSIYYRLVPSNKSNRITYDMPNKPSNPMCLVINDYKMRQINRGSISQM